MSNEPLPEEIIIPTLTKDKNWNGGVQGQSLSISYSFVTGLSPYYFDPGKVTFDANHYAWEFVNLIVDPSNPANFSAFNLNQQFATIRAIHAWESVANVTFSYAGDNNANAVITLGNATFNPDNYAITLDYGNSLTQGAYNTFGDIWLNSSGTKGVKNQTQTAPGQDGYQTILHELGHALGLEHPFDNDPNDPNAPKNLPAEFNNQRYTTMSYNKANM